ncbi:MAG: cell wall-binding repeat-containing protein [Rhodoglobus sp.]|nr:cell wall-binding repeat-containing protein [Rhodoglobus sp.]
MGQLGEVYSMPSGGPVQTGGLGTGTPHQITTTVGLGDTGLTAVQVDTYNPGNHSFSSTVTVSNASGATVEADVYRVLGCRLEMSSGTFTGIGPDSATCTSYTKAFSLTMDATTGAADPAAEEAFLLQNAMEAGEDFDGLCRCHTVSATSGTAIGLHWGQSIGNGASMSVSSTVSLSVDSRYPPAGDSDGDGIPDRWEIQGVTIDGEFLDLPGWGATPDHKDVFLQVNWMSTQYSVVCNWSNILTGCAEKVMNFAPSASGLRALIATFANSGVPNPDGHPGIRLHVDAGTLVSTHSGEPWAWPNGGMSIQYREHFSASDDDAAVLSAFATNRDEHMRESRQAIFHLVTLGHQISPGMHGTSGIGEAPGDDFFVSVPAHDAPFEVAQTILHELGHNLGLSHGGPIDSADSELNCKPDYRSVMNYLYQNANGLLDYSRTASPSGNRPITPAEIEDCLALGGKHYPHGPYVVSADWPELTYDGGELGSFNYGSGVAETPGVIEEELELETLRELGLVGTDGDGGVRLPSPFVLIAADVAQSLDVTVSNPGSIPMTYSLAVSVNGTETTRTVSVPAKTDALVTIPVDGSALTPGELTVAAVLSAGGEILAETSLPYPVLPNDPFAAQEALDLADSTSLAPEQQALLDAVADVIEEVAAGLVVDRLAGPDRYATAVEVSKEFDPGVPIVYVATGLNYPDALSAGAAAAAQGGPVLLTTPDSLPTVVKTELARLDPDQIVVVGSTASVSAAVATQLATYGPVRRDGGTDRYHTSRILIERAFESADTVYVATGANFPDALSASPPAATDAAPVLLVPGTSSDLPSSAGELIEELGTTSVVIAGGTGTVSAGIQSDIDALPGVSVTRKAGSDRFGTSLLLNQHAFTAADTVFLATGLSFPDALAGGALAGGLPSPLFAVLPTCIPPAIADEIERLGPARIVLLGGTPTLAPSVESLTRC